MQQSSLLVRRASNNIFHSRHQLFRSFHKTAVNSAVHKLNMPALSPTMAAGTIKAWRKMEGEKIEVGDIIADVQTDKAVIEFEAQEPGILAKVVIPTGTENVTVGELIAYIVDKKEELPLAQQMEASSASLKQVPSSATIVAPAAAAAAVTSGTQQISVPQHQTVSGDYKKPLGPAVKILLEQYNLDPRVVPGTGKNGRLLKGDVLQYVKSKSSVHQVATSSLSSPVEQALAPAPTPVSVPQVAPKQATRIPPASNQQQYEDVPASNIRQVIARRLLESKQTIPHFYMMAEVNVDGLLKMRQMYQEKQGLKLSVNDFIMYFAAKTLEKVPQCNAVFVPAKNEHQISPSIDVAFAMATPSGLITPIVRNANKLSIADLANTVKELGKRAKDNKLKPEEFQGGSFCVSNLGMFGIAQFEAVINPPHAVILSIGTTQKKVIVPQPTASNIDNYDDAISQPISMENATAGSFITVTANCDSRALDGLDVARFLSVLRSSIEQLGL